MVALDDPLNAALYAIAAELPAFDADDYTRWLGGAGAFGSDQREAMAGAVLRLPDVPLVSVALGIESVRFDPAALARTLASIDAQIAGRCEVVIACSEAMASEIRRLAGGKMTHGAQVSVIESEADDMLRLENVAWRHAEGELIGFLAAGDLLAWQAMGEISLLLADLPATAVIYTDEDWVDASGRRTAPRFRTVWDFDAQLGLDQMGRFSPIRRKLIEALDGLNITAGLAAHYDLHCRAADAAGQFAIRHLPAVLRHAARPSTIDFAAGRAYVDAARVVSQQAARRTEAIECTVGPAALAPALNRVRWPLPVPAPLVSVLVPTRDKPALVRAVADGVLRRTDYPAIELLILDNGSVEQETLDLFAELAADERVRIVPAPGPFNYSAINNTGLAAARGEVIVLLNNDIEIIGSGWLAEMVSHSVRLDVGCVGARLLFEDRRVQHAGVVMARQTGCAHVGRLTARDHPGINGDLAYARSFSAVTGACLAVRRSVIDEVAGLDEVAFRIGYNDVDLCLRIRDRGYRTIVTPHAELFHLESVSRGANDNLVKRAQEAIEQGRAKARWCDVFIDDPFQNPNLLRTWDGDPTLVAARRPARYGSGAR